MGKRFLAVRYRLERYSSRRAFLRLNEGDFEPHRMRPYGLEEHGFAYHQMFQKRHRSREGNRRLDRSVKKAARQRARIYLRESQEY